MSADDDRRYGIVELAELGGVSRRAVRYYVQQGLLPAAEGTGRGGHYTARHLGRLIKLRQLQEEGVRLAEISTRLDGRSQAMPSTLPLPAASWTRLRLAEDIEIHLRTHRKGPWLVDENRVARLEAAIRRLFET